MPIAELGRWEFYVPEGWTPKDSGIGVSYIEAPGGNMGFYQKTIKMPPEIQSAKELAEYIQGTHRRTFEAQPRTLWSVVGYSGSQRGDQYWSRLDLWDETLNYRILSVVACTSYCAIQLTMHDYECSDYEDPNPQFDDIERSLKLFAGAA